MFDGPIDNDEDDEDDDEDDDDDDESSSSSADEVGEQRKSNVDVKEALKGCHQSDTTVSPILCLSTHKMLRDPPSDKQTVEDSGRGRRISRGETSITARF